MRSAPSFALPDQTGAIRSLVDYSGRWLVVYFYPKDDTPGCTTEACDFRDVSVELEAAGVSVVGISMDGVASHAAFAKAYNLHFPLLADETGATVRAYGAWNKGVVRSTFVVNPAGQIVKAYPEVTPEGHAGQIVADMRLLQLSAI